MAKYQIKKSEFVFAVLCIINAVLRIRDINGFEYIFSAILILMYLSKKIDAEKCLLFIVFVPNKYLQLVVVALYLAVKRKLIARKMDKELCLFTLYILGIGIINCFLHAGNIIQVIFQTVLYYCIIRFAAEGRKCFYNSEISVLFDTFFAIQLLIVALQFAYYRRGGDPIKGSFLNAHYLGVFFVVYLYIVVKQKGVLRKKIFVGILVIGSIILCDAKHVGAIFVVSFLACLFLNKIIGEKRIIWIMSVGLVLVVFGGAWLLSTGNIPEFVSSSKLFRIYVLNSEYNKKIIFICRTIEQMISLNGLMGFGVGLYGSQIAITMGKGVIYSWDLSLARYNVIAQPYKNAINGLMTEGYVKYGIANSSMVLGYPLVSFVAMVAELGGIGFLWFIKLINKAYYDCDKSLIVFFLGICVFDTYFEIAPVFVLIMIGTVFSDKKIVKGKFAHYLEV